MQSFQDLILKYPDANTFFCAIDYNYIIAEFGLKLLDTQGTVGCLLQVGYLCAGSGSFTF